MAQQDEDISQGRGNRGFSIDAKPVSQSAALPQKSAIRPNAPAQGFIPQTLAKGFHPMPVRVSNGEYEFTPEQVANIGGIAMGSQAAGPMAQ